MTPKLRFPEFTNEWQTKSLDELIDRIESGVSVNSEDRSKKDGEYGILKTSAVASGAFYSKENKAIPQIELSRAKLNPQKDTIIVSRMNTPQLVGESGYVAKTYDDLFIPDRLWSVTINAKYNAKWLSYILASDRMRNVLSNIASGTSNSMKNISQPSFLAIKVLTPKQDEQQKIADFLTTVDKKIETIDKKVELLKQYKKSIVQKIFSQQIRFKDENENGYPDWNKKSLGEILDYEQPTKYIVRSTDYDESFKTPVLTAGKSFILGYTDETDNVYDNVPVIIFDDFTAASQFVDFPFKVKSSAMKILRARPGVNIKIAYELLRQIEYSAEDHKRHWIGEFQQFSVNVPCEEEQQEIADFLTSIDAKIKVEEIKLDSVKRFKKALLQRMFV